MWLKNLRVLMFGFLIYRCFSAKHCVRRYVNGKWISEGDCGGPEKMSEIMKELHMRSEQEKQLLADKEWTVFQRRKYGNVDFFRGWDEYVNGFGDKDGDFWLGLEKLHQRTKGENMELEIKLTTKNKKNLTAKYSNFSVGPGSDKYRLHASGYSGNAGDNLRAENNERFSTKDADHDSHATWNCASRFEGAWWYTSTQYECGGSNLNGNYAANGGNGVVWINPTGQNVLDFSEMKFRRLSKSETGQK